MLLGIPGPAGDPIGGRWLQAGAAQDNVGILQAEPEKRRGLREIGHCPLLRCFPCGWPRTPKWLSWQASCRGTEDLCSHRNQFMVNLHRITPRTRHAAAGYVSEHAAYHHGESSLQGAFKCFTTVST